MSVTFAQIKTSQNNVNTEIIEALFLYPKVILFEDNKTFRFVDLETKTTEPVPDRVYQLEHEIQDKKLIENYLWLVVKSGELLIINVLQGSKIKIKSDNFENYRICRLKTAGGKLFLFSESEECLGSPLCTQDLDKAFANGTEEITVTFEKVRSLRFDCDYLQSNLNGLKIYSEYGQIAVQCPISGLTESIESNIQIKYVLPWRDLAVVASNTNMWLVDLKDSNIAFNFDNPNQRNFYPLAAYNNGFYYMIWDKAEVHIFCAWNVSAPAEEYQDTENLNTSISKSSQVTLKSQMQQLIDAALYTTAEPEQVLTQFKTFFEKIEDLAFLFENASKLCQHDILYKSLLHPLQKRIHATDDQNLIDQLGDLMVKVDLEEYILFRGNKTYDEINLFSQNYKQLCKTFISKSDLDLASICWLKYSEMKLNIMPEDVMEILDTIPHNIKMGALIIWLRNFVPPLLDENPYYIDLFVRWTTQRVFFLEQSSYWPKIGLKFIEEILTVLEKSSKTISIRPISMDGLDVLKDHINYIMELKEKYKINMLLGEISSQNPSEVALIMLRRCYTEDLSAFLQDYLPTYATRYLFELDDTLRSFIENEAASCGGSIDSSRLNLIIGAFRSPTSKLDCLLQVLKALDVPWDETVLDLAIAAAASAFKDFTVTDADRVLAQEIQQELNYAKIKVVLKKYNFPLSCTDYTLVIHKLINAATVDLNDLKVITGVLTNFTNYGSVLYIDRCLRDCETRSALNYFNELPNKNKRILLKTILTKYEQIINGNTSVAAIERNYLDFLKGTQMMNNVQINNVENLYHLKTSYNIPLTINSLYNEEYVATKTELWISGDTVTASSGRGRCVTQLTRTHLSRHAELIALLRRTSTSNRIRKLIEKLLLSMTCDENSSITADISTVLSLFKDGRNSSLLLESFNVLIELMNNCLEEHIHYLIRYISVLNALINTNIVVKNLSITWKFHYIFLPMLSITATNDLIDYYCKNKSKINSDHFCANIVNKNDFLAFRVASHAMENVFVSEDTLLDLDRMNEKASKRLITKISTSQDLDELLLTGLLLILNSVEDSEDKFWILDIVQGQNDSLPPALMGYLSSALIRRTFILDSVLPGNATLYPPQYVLKSKFNINLAEMALPDSTEETWDVRVVLFHVLRQYPDTTFERLVELCNTLNVPINDGLSLQLISLLSTWELKYKVFNDDLGCRQLYLHNDEKDITAKCFSIWESLDDKAILKDILNDFWKNGEVTLHGRLVSINPYFYEVYTCIYHLIYGSSADTSHKREYFLLNFLKEYRRKSSPKQYEYESFSVKGMFPEIGHYRLPFHLFMREDMWSNLKSEITLETYERWLPAVVMLSLDADSQTARDMICSNALKQTMTTRKRNEPDEEDSKESEPWRLTTREEPLLRAAHRCVRHIANMEWAGACLFYVLQGCARGADQVAAAHLCYQFAQRWAALQPGNRAVRQMERLHSTLSTRHALQKIEWACEEFLKLAAEPAQLIRAMYLHPNFVEKMSRHDVNRAANEIADKNGINISSIRIQILENILTRSNEENKANGSCGLDTKKLMTAKYILKATCPKMGAIYLSRIAFDDESDFNKCKKLRALQCLMSVVDSDTAVKVTYRQRDALWSALLELLYIVNLESIDMPWLAATFSQDKIRALEQLLQASIGNVEGLKLSADLAKKFGNVQLIRELIPLLLRSGLYEDIIPLLLKISAPPDDVIYTAWRAVILSPFQRADYPITERQKAKCLNAINLLPVCPIIKDEDLIEIWKNCVRCKCFGLGCLVLPYITPQKRQTLSELQKIDRRNLIASLKNLHSETYLVSGAMTVVESMSSRYR
ncbi:hypothetical protein O0L34_g9558 [Tuta absoluta]|nr:hypothetical protein O0L34_g9558 [Tuta absoluta]